MNISRKSGARIVVLAVAAVGLLTTGLVPAQAETVTTTEHDIPFSALHPCTFERTLGDHTVHMVFTVNTSADGSMNVHSLQHTHGHQLIGETSGHSYNFNNAEDLHEHNSVGSSGGHFFIRTEYIHHGESQANLETLGLDDFHQRIYVRINSDGTATPVKTEAECR
ncbi:MAG: hypothetical protein M3280_12510 [Actinomycetota bacterium]|nr:hypothetical protein [Actinomycetota bacterium]